VAGRVGVRASRRGFTAVRVLVLAAVLAIPACQTTQDALDGVQRQQDDMTRRMQEAIRRCKGDEACIKQVREDYRKLNLQYEELRLKILQESWEDARKLRDDIIKKLLELIPKYPELKDLLDELLRQRDKDKNGTGDGKIDATPKTPSGSAGPGQSNRGTTTNGGTGTTTRELTLSGKFTFDSGNLAGTYAISGSLVVAGGWNSSGYNATVVDGKVVVTTAAGGRTFPVDKAYALGLPSTITTDSSGAGRIFLVLNTDAISLPLGPASAMIGPAATIELPVTVDATGGVHFNFAHGPTRTLFPYTPWPSSDYDQNGVLDATADLSAFMNGWFNHEVNADVNLDGLWDQTDLDLWDDHFQEDVANM